MSLAPRLEVIPDRVTVRLDDDLRGQIAQWMSVNDVDQLSTAVRLCLISGLTRIKNLEPDFVRQLIREVTRDVRHALETRLNETFNQALSELREGVVTSVDRLSTPPKKADR